jgi:hypothetical protein
MRVAHACSQAVGAFLDATAPPLVLDGIVQLENAVAVGLNGPAGKLSLLRSGITTFATAQADLSTRLTTISALPAALTTMRGAVGDVQTRLASLPWTDALVGAIGSSAGGPMALLHAALTAMDTATWATTLTAAGTAIDFVSGLRNPSDNPYTGVQCGVHMPNTRTAQAVCVFCTHASNRASTIDVTVMTHVLCSVEGQGQ